MNIDEKLIEAAITVRTKAIVPVHYAGVACEMDIIMDIANRHNLFVVEDAAQGMMSSYNGKPLGSIGHLGTFSFHETKNYTSGGEGGLLIINDSQFSDRAEIIREKGTNRSQFFRGEVDKYTWVDIGSSYLLSEVQAAYLWGQLEEANKINESRLNIWLEYDRQLKSLGNRVLFDLPAVPTHCSHNAHMYYIKLKNIDVRTKFISYLRKNNIETVFHYVPLHNALAGKKNSIFHGSDNFTTRESERVVRLPLFNNLTVDDVDNILDVIKKFRAV